MADKRAFQSLPLIDTPVASPAPGGVAAPGRPEVEEYLVTDGLPMSDSDFQAFTMRDAHCVLEHYFHNVRGDPNVYVAIDTMVHYERYNYGKHLAPDVMVVLGVSGHGRDSYQTWEEGGRAPDFVLEVLSRSTHLRDENDKRKAYRDMGVGEYFRFDPKGTTMARRTGRRLEGERLVDGLWKPLERQGEERIFSEVLGLELRVKREETEPDYRELRFWNPRTGEELRKHSEAEARGDREAARADAERRAREREAARADAERRAREREAARADAAERKSAELEALLAELAGSDRGSPFDEN